MSNTSPNILVLTSWSMGEGLIQSYTFPYLKMIQENLPEASKLYLLTLEKNQYKLTAEQTESESKRLLSKRIIWKPKKYSPFGLIALIRMTVLFIQFSLLIKKKKITIIHAICTPSGMLGYLLSKVSGVELVIDSFEPHSDIMVQSGTWKKNGFAYKLLSYFEQQQIKQSSYLIAANKDVENYISERYQASPAHFLWKPACVEQARYEISIEKRNKIREQLGLGNKKVCIYTGKLSGMYLAQEVFDFFKVADDFWKGDFAVILLNSLPAEEIRAFCKKSGVNPDIIHHHFVPHHQVSEFVGGADFGLSLFKPIPANRYTTPVKNGEYWATGLPVIITEYISEDSSIIQSENIGYVLKETSKNEYVKSLTHIDLLLNNEREKLQEKIKEVAKEYRNLSIAKRVYKSVYSRFELKNRQTVNKSYA